MSRSSCRSFTKLVLKNNLQVALFMCALLALAGPAWSADRVWQGSISTSWTNMLNWSGLTKPGAGDTVVFNNLTVEDSLDVDEAPAANLKFRADANLADNISIMGNNLTVAGDPAIDWSATGQSLRFYVGVTLTGASSFSGSSGNGLVFGREVNNGGFLLTTNSGNIWFSNGLSGAGGLTVAGGVTNLYVTAVTYTGVTTINGGTLQIASHNLLPDSADLVVNAAGTFALGNNNETIDQLSGSGSVTIGSTLGIGADDGTSTFSGTISGSGSLTKLGSGDFTLGGNNSYTGDTTISEGSLILGASNVISDASDISVAAGATFNLNNSDETVATLTGNGDVTLGTGTLSLGDAGDFTFSGTLGTGGTGSIIKQGSGTFTLDAGTGIIFTAGAVNITDGTLQNNSVVTGSAVNVQNGATLSGNGTLLGGLLTVQSGGALSPGNSAGTVILNDGLDLLAGADLNLELNGTAAGADYDQIIADTSVDLAGDLNLVYGYTPSQGDSFTIIDNTSMAAVNGTFSGLAEGASWANGGYIYQISYLGGDGNDVVITVTGAPPDPTPPDPTPPTPAPWAPDAPASNPGAAGPDGGISADGFTLNWSPVSGASRYLVYRSTGPDGHKDYIGATTSSSYTDSSATPGETYYYWVRAAGGGETSASSGYMLGQTLEVNPGRLGDLSGNGADDLFWWGVDSAQLSLWSSEASSLYSVGDAVALQVTPPEGYCTASDKCRLLGLGDVNGDGSDELVWRNLETGMVTAWIVNRENGKYVTSEQLYLTSVENGYQSVEVGDLNGDGFDDIFWRNLATGDVWLWEMDGGEIREQGGLTVADGVQLTFDAYDLGRHISGLEDFDNDGNADILWQDQDTGDLCLWLMDARTVSGVQTMKTPEGWSLAGAADLNGDGMADLVLTNQETGQMEFMLLSGLDTVKNSAVHDLPEGWEIKGLGDLNGDGKSDLYLRNQETGGVRYCYMDGTTILADDMIGTARDYIQ